MPSSLHASFQAMPFVEIALQLHASARGLQVCRLGAQRRRHPREEGVTRVPGRDPHGAA